MHKIYHIKNINDTINFAKELSLTLKPHDIICLNGDLGVGKTVIAKEIAKFFKVEDEVISPTFNILKVYDTKNNIIKKIFHFDLYRIKNIDELYNIGFDEYISKDNAISIIEWPKVSYDILPTSFINIDIKYVHDNLNEREIIYEKI